MIWIAVVFFVLVICFGGVLLYGAPYLPTLTPQIHAAFELANLEPGQTLLELGCGDGKVLIAAAQIGVHSVGYELNPIMALVAWLRTRRYRKYVKVVWGNFWNKQWPNADVIFTFLLGRYMQKLDNSIQVSQIRPLKLVSFAFSLPEKQPTAKKAGVFLYVYK